MFMDPRIEQHCYVHRIVSTHIYIYTESRFECKVTELFLFYKSSVSLCFECAKVVFISFYFTNLQGSSVNAGIASTYIYMGIHTSRL